MPTTATDLAHGRQGGRVQPWQPIDHRFHPGQTVRFRRNTNTPHALGQDGTLYRVAELLPGWRARVHIDGTPTPGPTGGTIVGTPLLVAVDPHRPAPADDGLSDPEDTLLTYEAATLAADLAAGQRIVLNTLIAAGDRGSIDADFADASGWAIWRVADAREALVARGCAIESTERRLDPTSAYVPVWKVTPLGRRVWNTHTETETTR